LFRRVIIVENVERSTEHLVREVEMQAQQGGRKITRRAKRELRGEVAREIVAEIARGQPQPPLSGIADAAHELLAYAEKIGAFQVKTRIGTVVVRRTIEGLRSHFAKTRVCICWPFCSERSDE
jgi:hypothetical protein